MWSTSKAYEQVFTTKLLEIPILTDDDVPEWLRIPHIADFQSKYLRLDELNAEDLPDLKNNIFQLDTKTVPLPEYESSATSSLVADSEDDLLSDNGASRKDDDHVALEDIWSLPEVTTTTRANGLLGWDNYLDTDKSEARSLYLSEQIPQIFTLAWTGSSEVKPTIPIAHPDQFLLGLRELGLGRNSLFFSFDENSGHFESLLIPFAIPGLTIDSLNAVINQFKQYGQQWRRLTMFVERIATMNGVDNTSVGFASCIQDILAEVLYSVSKAPSTADSLLHLQDVFQLPMSLLSAVDHLASSLDIPPLSLKYFLDRAEKLQAELPTLTMILENICQRVLDGPIQTLLASVGLQPRQQDRSQAPEIDCLTSEEAMTISGIQDALEILQHNDPEHSLQWCKSDKSEFKIQFSFTELAHLEQDALDYEARLKDVVRRTTQDIISPVIRADSGIVEGSTKPSPWDFYHGDELADGGHDMCFATAGSWTGPACSPLGLVVRKTLNDPSTNIGSESIPPQEAMSMSLRPILGAQHRLATFAVLDLLFDQHIDLHLTILQRYSLFGDGLFVNRLSHALFDPEQASGEGRRRDGGVTGLRLQSRETWPPASSELRLALMGILTESITSHLPTARDVLIDSISFSIRDLSDEELDKCRNVDSIHALDFLRLRYKPLNTALEAIITPTILDKYDRIFQYLLRLLRLQTLAQQLLRQISTRHRVRSTNNHEPDHRFRLHIQHFISALASHSTSTAILIPWQHFESHVTRLKAAVVQRDYEETTALAHGGLDTLRQLHERTLDDILSGLFLKTKQRGTMELLEDIFGIVLRFAAAVRNRNREDNEGGGDGNADGTKAFTVSTQRMYNEFQTKTKRFVDCVQAAELEFGLTPASAFVFYP